MTKPSILGVRRVVCVAAIAWLLTGGASGLFAQTTATLTGRTLAPDGSPAPGVKIRFDFPGPAGDAATVYSGTDGSFSLATPHVQETAYIQAGSPLFGKAQLRYPAPVAGKTSNPIEIKMSGIVLVEGRVLDPDGRPVKGVTVFNGSHAGEYTMLISYGEYRTRIDAPPKPEPTPVPAPTPAPHPGYGTTGADGSFSLGVSALPEDGKPLQLCVIPPRPSDQNVMGILESAAPVSETTTYFQAQHLERPAKHGDSLDLTIRLAPADRIVFAGTVRDAKGDPVPKAAVKAFVGHPSGKWIDWIFANYNGGGPMAAYNSQPVPVGYAISGPDGRYRIEAIAESPESLLAQWGRSPKEAGYSIGAAADPNTFSLSPRFELAAGEHERTVDVALPSAEQASSIDGRAVDPDGKPLAGVKLVQSPQGGSATTGPDGRFRLQIAWPYPVSPRGPQQIRIASADSSWRVVNPDPADRFNSNSTFDDLREAGALLVLEKADAPPRTAPAPPNPGGAPGPRGIAPPPRGRGGRGRDAAPGPDLTAHLRVVSADGRPLAGYRVYNGGSHSAITDKTGDADIQLDARRSPVFYVGILENGTVNWILRPTVHDSKVDSTTLTLGGDPSASGAVRFGGVPRSSVSITLETEDGRISASGTTDAEGRFSIDGIPPGPAILTYRPPGIFAASQAPSRVVTVGPESRGLDLELPAPDLILHLPPPDPATPYREVLRIVNLDKSVRPSPTGSAGDGRTDVPVYGLEPGRYLFELQTSFGQSRLISRLGPVEFKKNTVTVELTMPGKAGN